jgi:predicted dehydrogenase
VDQFGVAVIGLGIGRRHVQAYRGLTGVKVVAVADADEKALSRARGEFPEVALFTDYRQVLDRDDIHLVSICTPDRLHAEQAVAALAAGKHVLCEKPLATSLEDAARIVRKVQETGLTFMVGHNYRFIPQFVELKHLVAAGAVGDLFYGQSSYIQDLYFMEELGPDYWRLKDPQDFYLGGAVHNVDLLRWVVGEIEEVASYSNHGMPFYPLDDNYVSAFRFSGGRIGQLTLLLGSRLKDKFYVDLSVFGPGGSLKAVMQRDEIVENVAGTGPDAPLVRPIPPADSHALEIAHFVECVRDGKRPLVDVVEGARAIAVCLAAIRSARERRPIAVDYGGISNA